MASQQYRGGKDTMQIFVRNMITEPETTGRITRTSTLVVKPTDTIYDVMVKMEEITGVPPILQRMTFRGKSLYDYTPGTLADHKIGKESTLQAVYYNSGWGRLQEKTLKALWIAADDVEEKMMRLAVTDYINLGTGQIRTITLEVEAGDTVASVMEQVQRRKRYPVAMQLLTCDGRPMCPDGGATLADYNVTEDSKLELRMSMAFAIALDKEERRAKEIAAHVEHQQQQLADDKK